MTSIASRFGGRRDMPTKSASKTITRDQDWLGPAIPPGEILLEEYLKPLGLGQLKAAKRLGISLNRLNEIVLGKRGITADTALRLARLLKTSPQFWTACRRIGICTASLRRARYPERPEEQLTGRVTKGSPMRHKRVVVTHYGGPEVI